MRKTLAILAFAPLVACGGPPETVSIEGFDAAHEAAALDAVQAWCDAVGSCPEIVSPERAQLRIRFDADYARHGRKAGSGAFENGSGHIFVSPTLVAAPLEDFWHTIAHEYAHTVVDGHPCPTGSILGAALRGGEGRTSIDDCARDAWIDAL